MHNRAAKNPSAEITGCHTKLLRLQDDVGNMRDIAAAEQETEVRRIVSRLLHVRGRLERVSSSPTYQVTALQVLKSCKELLTLLEDHTENSVDLNESIDAIKTVNIEPVTLPLTAAISKADSGPSVPTHIPSATPIDKPVISRDVAHTSSPIGEPLSTAQNVVLNDLMEQVRLMSEQIQMLSQYRNQQSIQVSPQDEPVMKPLVTVSSDNNIHNIDPVIPQWRTSEPDFVNPIKNPSVNARANTVPGQPLATLSPNGPSNLNWNPATIHPHNNKYHMALSENTPFVQGDFQTSSMPVHSTFGNRSLARSGISFNGSTSGITVDMFLFQLETVSASLHLSAEALMFEISTVLKDVALQWYWIYRRHHPSAGWVELRRDFLERFQDRRTSFEIRRAIESRKQQANENFLDFYHHMWGLTLQCHSPYSDEEFIQLLLSNMKPSLQYHLTDRHFTSIGELIKSCTAWEDTFRRCRVTQDHPPYFRRGINELSVGAYEETEKHAAPVTSPIQEASAECSVSALQTSARFPVTASLGTEKRSSASTLRPSTISDNHPICYNCSDIGHTSKDCPIPATGLYCYRCGLRDTITPRCRRCAERAKHPIAENQTSGSWRTGVQGPPNMRLLRVPQTDAASNTDPELARRTSPP